MFAGWAAEVDGGGLPVVMVHGLGGSTNTFGAQAAVLARWYRCIRFDIPGAGSSPRGDCRSIEDMVRGLLAAIDAAVTGPFHLVGHSMGTVLCQYVALTRPDQVRRMVLLGPIAEPAPAARTALRSRALEARSSGMTPVADAVSAAAPCAATRAVQPALVALFRESLMRQDAEGYARHCIALSEAMAAPADRILAATLLLTGDEDSVSPVPAVAALASRLPRGTMAVIPRCGHLTPLEQPAEVTARIAAFIADEGRAFAAA